MGCRQKGEGDTGAACKGQRWGEMLWYIRSQLLSPGLTLQSPFGESFVTARVKYKWEQSNTPCVSINPRLIPADSPGKPPLRVLLK